jgi:parallel beta-helix repeat protein
MMGKRRATLVVLLVLNLFLISTQEIEFTAANFMVAPISIPEPAFIIRNDGSIYSTDNVTVPIQQVGYVYTLTDDIVGYTIAVDCDNVVIDGGSYTLQGYGNSTGIFIKNRNEVTVRNMQISNFFYGIRLLSDSSALHRVTGKHNVTGNNLTNNSYGIHISSSSENVLRNNRMNNNTYSFHVTVNYFDMAYDFEINPAIFYHDIDTSNTANGYPIYYWVNMQDKAVPLDAAYVGLVNCTNMKVQNLNLSGKPQGILLVSTTYSTIAQNKITNNSGEGIYLLGSSNNTIFKNYIANNGMEIYVYRSSSNNSIYSNNITKNNGYGIRIFSSSNNKVFENIINVNKEDGVYLSRYSSYNNISENSIIGNNQGVQLDSFCAGNDIIGNTITENDGWGIKLTTDANFNFISENNIEKNGVGIFCYYSSYNRIIGNKVIENDGWGIRLEGGQVNNTVYHNYFIDNKVEEGLQVSMPGRWAPGGSEHANPCVWDDGERGNYWSDYVTRYPNAKEINGSGVGVTPYFINPNNIDHYPIMTPVGITVPEFPSWIILPLTSLLALILIVPRKNLVMSKGFKND